ncbi:hypothetical protein JZU54_06520, partial [bacterium]|nr:hypothetical protein [bacterium]
MRSATSPEDTAVCELDPAFHALLAEADFRLKARMVLISRYFEPIERVALFETLGIKGPSAGRTGAERMLAT